MSYFETLRVYYLLINGRDERYISVATNKYNILQIYGCLYMKCTNETFE
jgi:hypothetical protein